MVFRYIRRMMNYRIKFKKANLGIYYDSDWDGCDDNVKASIIVVLLLKVMHFHGLQRNNTFA